MIFMNIWGINHDPDEFDDPHLYDPSRFLRNPNGTKKGLSDGSQDHRRPVWTFGGGRRVCVGQHMARQSLLMVMARLVWCFDIEAASSDGLDLSMNGFHSGMSTTPKPFKAKFRVRDEDRKQVIEREWKQGDDYLKQFE